MGLVTAAILSVLLAIIEILYHAKVRDFRALFVPAVTLYILLLFIGNMATTIGSSSLVDQVIQENLPADSASEPGGEDVGFLHFLSKYPWFWYAFIGVFSFHALLKNINVTFFDANVLTISEWLKKARDSAVASVVEVHAQRNKDKIENLAHKLTEIPDGDLNTQITAKLGAAKLAEINKAAEESAGNLKLAKALALAYNDYATALSIYKAWREQEKNLVSSGMRRGD